MQLNFWENLKKPIFTIAPMSGVTDEAFRMMFLKYGRPDVFWTEFIPAEGLFSRGRDQCLKTIKFNPKEHPIIAQIFGTDPLLFEKAAHLIAELGFDGIDINMGCPDKDVEKKGGGAALIKNPGLAVEIIRATKRGAGNIPVSVKTRIGYAKNEIPEWIPIILKENIAALIVHLRTREELFGIPAHWSLAPEIVKLRDCLNPKTRVLGNGDINSISQARQLTEDYGLDGVMVGRGTLGNPWFFSEKLPLVEARINAIFEHAIIFENLHKEDMVDGYCKQFDSIKKYFHGYTKEILGARELRAKLMKVKNASEINEVIKSFLKS